MSLFIYLVRTFHDNGIICIVRYLYIDSLIVHGIFFVCFYNETNGSIHVCVTY